MRAKCIREEVICTDNPDYFTQNLDFCPLSDTVAFYAVLTDYDTINSDADQPVPFNLVLVNDGDG